MIADRLDDTEMLGLLRLANRLHDLPANPVVRHEFMLRQLCAMTGASAGISALLEVPPNIGIFSKLGKTKKQEKT